MENLTLAERIDASPYLTGLRQQFGFSIDAHSADVLPAFFDSLFERLQNYDFSDYQEQAVTEQLLHSKAEFSYYWCLAHLNKTLTISELGQWQTRFAEVSINFALRASWCKEASKHKVLQATLSDNQFSMPGMFVLGMGKLGGRDLNFSSDVDLVAYYSPEELAVPDLLGKNYIAHRVLQSLTKLLNQQGAVNFVWRVDWRLRPNASATTLAMSTHAAEDYYFFHASPWHRLALMKARVIAGDMDCGQQFMNLITPFIWRQNLDFRALDELAEIKSRINLEHPALKSERSQREPIMDDIGGFNVKLGRGGIREIEFIANALQLVWGGKNYALRISNTVNALTALGELGLLPSETAEHLIKAYACLREVENCLQFHGNRQTQLIPKEAHNQKTLLALMGLGDWQGFADNLNRHRRFVNQEFEGLFNNNQNETESKETHWPETLSDAAKDIVARWEAGYLVYGVPQSMTSKLLPLTQSLAQRIAQIAQHEQSEVIVRIHDFFRSLPQGGQYFRLLAESTRLLDSIVPPLMYSPAMTTLLTQSPHIVDTFMVAPEQGKDQEKEQQGDYDSDYIFFAERYEIRLERLRRFVNEHLYQYYLQFIQAAISVEQLQTSLSALAKHTLDCGLRMVQELLELEASPITIIGMGKLGMRRMSPMSDLDLIFVFDPDVADMELASRFVSRFQTAITSPMREGIVYELDTRLRPSGKSGAPTVSLESFHKHHLNRAHTWEHLALVPAGVTAGNLGLSDGIMQIKRDILTRGRDRGQFYRDAIKMWHRIAKHRIKDLPADTAFSKLRPGGLMQAEYLAQMLVIQSGSSLGEIDFANYDALLEHASHEHGIDGLADIIQFWRIQQIWERLLGLSEQPISAMASHYQETLLQQSGVQSLDELIEKKSAVASQVTAKMEQLFAEFPMSDAEIEDWKETSVNWC